MFRAVRRPLAARKSLASLSRAHKHDVNVKERHARARCERQSARRCGSHEKKQRPQNPRAPPHTKRDMAPRASRFTSAARSPVKILFPRHFFCEPNRKCLRTGLSSEINAIQLVVTRKQAQPRCIASIVHAMCEQGLRVQRPDRPILPRV